MFRRFFLSAALFIVFASAASAAPYCDQSKMGGQPLPFDTKGIFNANCVPEVLYSWQEIGLLQAAQAKGGASGLLPKGYLYLWRTPAGTIGYGNAVARVKLATGVKFVFEHRHECATKRVPQEEKTVFVHYSEDGQGPASLWSEYVICDPAAIDSWSYATDGIADEMRREFDWVREHRACKDDYDWFVNPQAPSKFANASSWLGLYPWIPPSPVGPSRVSKTDRPRPRVVGCRNRGVIAGEGGSPNSIATHHDYVRPTYFFAPDLDPNAKLRVLGARVVGTVAGGATASAKKFCAGKSVCHYEISSRFIPDPAPKLDKSFRMEWTCGVPNAPSSASLPSVREIAVGDSLRKFDLECPEGTVIDVTDATYGANLTEGFPKALTPSVVKACGEGNRCAVTVPVWTDPLADGAFALVVTAKCSNSKSTIAVTSKIKDGAARLDLACRKVPSAP